MDFKLLKSIVKGLITFIPGFSRILKERKKKTEHSGTKAEFAYSLWLSTLVYLKENKINKTFDKIGEIGNGGSLGVAFCALLSGSKCYYSFEVIDNFDIKRQLTLLDDIVTLFRSKTPIQKYKNINIEIEDYSFPEDLVLSSHQQQEISAQLRFDLLENIGKSKSLFIINNWEKEQSLGLDFIFSRAVMEHVKDPSSIYIAAKKHLLPQSFMFHDIELHSHGVTKKIDEHFKIKPFLWHIIYGKRPFFLNRWSLNHHINAIIQIGFIIVSHKEVLDQKFNGVEDALYGATILAKKLD